MKKCAFLMMGFLFVLFAALTVAAEDVFEAKGTITDSTFYRSGKIEKDKPGGEVVYQVNVPKRIVTRIAVYNTTLPQDQGGGLQSDNTVYNIAHDFVDVVSGQRLIKAVGQTGIMDGYETIVIGEDFITTSRSSSDYFVLYSYKRTDSLAERYRLEKTRRQ